MPSQPSTAVRLRWPRIALAATLGCAALWHVLPHLTWALYLEGQLEAMPHAQRLEVSRVSLEQAAPHSSAAAAGPSIRHAGIALQLPDDAVRDRSCEALEPICQLELSNGRVVVHSTPPPEDFWEMVWLRAPDRRDLSLLRSASFNWNTIDALRTRVMTSRAALDSWRFESAHARGVVAQMQLQNVSTPNYVVAAYAREGEGSRILGTSRLPRRELDQLLSTIQFYGFDGADRSDRSDRSDAPATP